MTTPERAEHFLDLEAYQRYMEFTSSERDPWRADYLSQQLVVLGAERPNVSSQEATNLRNCYENPYRSYHGEQHGNFVGQPDVPAALAEQLSPAAREWAGAVLSVSGLWHDAVYKQVDTHPDSETGKAHGIRRSLSLLAIMHSTSGLLKTTAQSSVPTSPKLANKTTLRLLWLIYLASIKPASSKASSTTKAATSLIVLWPPLSS